MFNTIYSRKKSGPGVMATLQNFVISILRLIGYQNIAKALRDMAAKPAIDFVVAVHFRHEILTNYPA